MRQEDLGEKIGKDRQTVYRIEKGGSTKRATVIKIASALGQSPKTALDVAFGLAPESPRPHVAARQEDEFVEIHTGSVGRLAYGVRGLYSAAPQTPI